MNMGRSIASQVRRTKQSADRDQNRCWTQKVGIFSMCQINVACHPSAAILRSPWATEESQADIALSHGWTSDLSMLKVQPSRVVAIELDIPVEVVAPAVGRRPYGELGRNARQPPWAFRLPDEAHPGLFRRPAALLPVAIDATGHDVLPTLLAGECHRYNVIKREILHTVPVSAILAAVIISSIDVRSGKLDPAGRRLDADE